MNLLPLDDPRWMDLRYRDSSGDDGWYVARALADLEKNPEDSALREELGVQLSSEDETWAAAYAAVPYFVKFAQQLPPKKRFDYLIEVGLIAVHSCPEIGRAYAIKSYLVDAYEEAMQVALGLLADSLTLPHDVVRTRNLLASVAALKGHRELGRTIFYSDGEVESSK